MFWQAVSSVHDPSPISIKRATSGARIFGADSQALRPRHDPDPMMTFEVEVPVAWMHARFPRHEPFPIVTYHTDLQAPCASAPSASEMQESVPILEIRTESHAWLPWQDPLPKVESELERQANVNLQASLPILVRAAKEQACGPSTQDPTPTLESSIWRHTELPPAQDPSPIIVLKPESHALSPTQASCPMMESKFAVHAESPLHELSPIVVFSYP